MKFDNLKKGAEDVLHKVEKGAKDITDSAILPKILKREQKMLLKKQ